MDVIQNVAVCLFQKKRKKPNEYKILVAQCTTEGGIQVDECRKRLL